MQRTSITLSDDEFEALKAETRKQERSQNDILREAVRRYLDHQKQLREGGK